MWCPCKFTLLSAYESDAAASLRCSLGMRPMRTGHVQCEAVERLVLLFQARMRVSRLAATVEFKRLVTRGCFWSTRRTVPASGGSLQ